MGARELPFVRLMQGFDVKTHLPQIEDIPAPAWGRIVDGRASALASSKKLLHGPGMATVSVTVSPFGSIRTVTVSLFIIRPSPHWMYGQPFVQPVFLEG